MNIAVFLDVVQHGLIAVYLHICPKAYGNTFHKTIMFCQNSWLSGHDFSLGPPEYEAVVLTSQMRCSLVRNINATGTFKSTVNVHNLSHVQMLPFHSVDQAF